MIPALQCLACLCTSKNFDMTIFYLAKTLPINGGWNHTYMLILYSIIYSVHLAIRSSEVARTQSNLAATEFRVPQTNKPSFGRRVGAPYVRLFPHPENPPLFHTPDCTSGIHLDWLNRPCPVSPVSRHSARITRNRTRHIGPDLSRPAQVTRKPRLNPPSRVSLHMERPAWTRLEDCFPHTNGP